jgi:hypothetical protein
LLPFLFCCGVFFCLVLAGYSPLWVAPAIYCVPPGLFSSGILLPAMLPSVLRLPCMPSMNIPIQTFLFPGHFLCYTLLTFVCCVPVYIASPTVSWVELWNCLLLLGLYDHTCLPLFWVRRLFYRS